MNLKLLKLILLSLILFLVPLQTSAFSIFPKEESGFNDFRIYITAFYEFAIPASILVGVVMMMIGGIIWVTSAGDQKRISKAKEFIINSIIGVILLAGAFLILGVINPNLVFLSLPVVEKIGARDYGACYYEPVGQPYWDESRECEITTAEICPTKGSGSRTSFVPGHVCGEEAEARDRLCNSKGRQSVRRTNRPDQEECTAVCSPCFGTVNGDEKFGWCDCSA
jgi:hypothetical protein